MKNNFLMQIPKQMLDKKNGSILKHDEWEALGRLVQRLFESQNPKVLPALVSETLSNLDAAEIDLEDQWWDSPPEGETLATFATTESAFIIFHSRLEMAKLAGHDLKDEEWAALVVALNDLYASFFLGDGINSLFWGIQGELNGVPEMLAQLAKNDNSGGDTQESNSNG